MTCIFRAFKEQGKICGIPVAQNTKYCFSHNKRLNHVQRLLQCMFKSDEEIDMNNMYIHISNALDHGFTSEEIAKALSYIYDSASICVLAHDLQVPGKTKGERVMNIVHTFEKLHTFSKHKRAIHKLRELQLLWKSKRKYDAGPWPQEEAINDTDIFTLEELTTLPQGTVFSYKDNKGDIYAFSAPDLFYEIQQNGPKNPYNRAEIPRKDVDRLTVMMQHVPQKVMPKPEDAWRHPEEAFAYVLGEFERQHGIRANVEWLMKLSNLRILRIFYTFHSCVQFSTFMDLDIITSAYESHNLDYIRMALAKEMWRICQANDNEDHMYIICNLFFAIAHHSVDFKKYIPNWIMLGAASR